MRVVQDLHDRQLPLCPAAVIQARCHRPIAVDVMNLARHIAPFHQIESSPDLGEAPFAEQIHQNIAIPLAERRATDVLGGVLVVNPSDLLHKGFFLLLKFCLALANCADLCGERSVFGAAQLQFLLRFHQRVEAVRARRRLLAVSFLSEELLDGVVGGFLEPLHSLPSPRELLKLANQPAHHGALYPHLPGAALPSHDMAEFEVPLMKPAVGFLPTSPRSPPEFLRQRALEAAQLGLEGLLTALLHGEVGALLRDLCRRPGEPLPQLLNLPLPPGDRGPQPRRVPNDGHRRLPRPTDLARPGAAAHPSRIHRCCGHCARIHRGCGHCARIRRCCGHCARIHRGCDHCARIRRGCGHCARIRRGCGHCARIHRGCGHCARIHRGCGHCARIRRGCGHCARIHRGCDHCARIHRGCGHCAAISFPSYARRLRAHAFAPLLPVAGIPFVGTKAAAAAKWEGKGRGRGQPGTAFVTRFFVPCGDQNLTSRSIIDVNKRRY